MLQEPYVETPCKKRNMPRFRAARRKVMLENSRDRDILYVRVLICTVLASATVLFGVLSYNYLNDSEINLFEKQYESIATHSLDNAALLLYRMVGGIKTMTSVINQAFPDLEMWPNVTLDGYSEIARNIMNTTNIGPIALTTIVYPEQSSGFEAYAYNYYESNPGLVAEDTGVSSFGKGIFSINPALNSTLVPDIRYHSNTGYTPWGGTHNFMVPVIQQPEMRYISGNYLIMFNVYSDPTRGPMIDDIIDCVESGIKACAHFGDILPVSNPLDPFSILAGNFDTGSILTFPVQPANSPMNVTGFVGAQVTWLDLLQRIVPDSIDGFDCVITTVDQTYTYRITDSVPVLIGEGDHHDSNYDKYGRSRDLLDESNSLLLESISYHLTIYPRDEFLNSYQTDTPLVVCIGSVSIILLTSAIFLLYDYLMKRQSRDKQNVLDTKRRFVRFISHEVRTPLNTVKMGLNLLDLQVKRFGREVATATSAELLHMVQTHLSEWAEVIQDVLGNSESAVLVLDDLLNYDKVETRTLTLEHSAVQPWELIRKVANSFDVHARQEHIHLSMKAERWNKDITAARADELDHLAIVGDGNRLTQVLRNLLSNALKFTQSGGFVEVTGEWIKYGMPRAVVDVPLSMEALVQEPRAGSILISIRDSGPGLSHDQLRSICGEGVQFNANNLQSGQGSGLGLFITKGIVEQHSGNFTVESKGLGFGTTISVELPLFRNDDMDLYCNTVVQRTPPVPKRLRSICELDNIAQHPEAHSATDKPIRVLVVDDALSNRKFLTRLLKLKGYLCQEACDGKQAITAYSDSVEKKEVFDIITMDFEMPVMNGPDATKALRAMGCTCMIVGVSGNVLPTDVAHFRSYGADAVLPKPLSLTALETKWNEFVSEQLLSTVGTSQQKLSIATDSDGDRDASLVKPICDDGNALIRTTDCSNGVDDELDSAAFSFTTPATPKGGNGIGHQSPMNLTEWEAKSDHGDEGGACTEPSPRSRNGSVTRVFPVMGSVNMV